MLDDDIKMLDRHFMHSLQANGDLLGAWLRIKKKYVEAQKQQSTHPKCYLIYKNGEPYKIVGSFEKLKKYLVSDKKYLWKSFPVE